ncbi:ASKHA domain-containing protein [Acetobacterium tundrae]|nr:ASKHA domain-containing protein [Acetobacterium tundrae]
MPILSFVQEEKQHQIPFEIGVTIREILDTTQLMATIVGCRGNGACGLCMVHIKAGEVNEPHPNERVHLSQNQINQGIRLACQTKPFQNVRIELLYSVFESNWRSIPDNEYFFDTSNKDQPFKNNKTENQRKSYGVSVDLGTTNISLTVWDMEKKIRVADRQGLNGQYCFGSDVMTRLTAACKSVENAQKLGMAARNSIGEAIWDIASREFIDLEQIEQVIIVGNTSMLTLLSEKNYELMLNPEFWEKEIDCQPEDSKSWGELWKISPKATIEVVQPLAGFVGSDLIAGVLATQIMDQLDVTLLIDFGTNTEIALWDSNKLWVTSAAGGPAFEGCGISCGMHAKPGAIFKIAWTDAQADYHFEVIGAAEPRGICGSGMVDAIAALVNQGKLNANGKFLSHDITEGSFVLDEKHKISINNHDIDVFQRAKAAVGTGIDCLLDNAGMNLANIKKIVVCGAFGVFLNVENAQKIGLLPEIAPQNVILAGDTALAGCEMLLLNGNDIDLVKNIKSKAELINLANYPEFYNVFLENLFLKPMGEQI